jgi:cytochrome c peroxidase
VLDHYAAGEQANPNKSASIRGFPLTADQRSDLIAFLKSLTDDALLHDPRFSDPWTADAKR